MIEKYNLFIPPKEVTNKTPKEWNKLEAKKYFDWFIKIKSDRIGFLLGFLNYRISGDIYKDISEISKKINHFIFSPNFHYLDKTGRKRLNGYGLSIATDFGLFIASLLQKENPSLEWKIGIGHKTYHSYNLPVLNGFSNGEIDLIFISINNTKYDLNNPEDIYDWLAYYKYLEQEIN